MSNTCLHNSLHSASCILHYTLQMQLYLALLLVSISWTDCYLDYGISDTTYLTHTLPYTISDTIPYVIPIPVLL